jgi:phthiocerol/phenolphthiocerol synthesis type-I polyketide synthase E
MKQDSFPPHAIAVVGLSGRFPGARDLDHFWQNIRNGVEIIETLSEADLDTAGVGALSRNDPAWVRKATTLEGALDFDTQFFGISPREAQFIDPQQRVFLECAHEALEHAGWGDRTDGLSVGVYAGAGMNWYLLEHIAANPEAARAVGAYQIMLGNDKDFLCTRASYKLDLRGPSVTIQTACSTSLVAVVTACRALARGECDMALAGGVGIVFPERTGYRYEVGMILSPDGHCRPFDAEAAGIRPGAGAGVVVLKRLADAVADRDTIHAVIRGGAINNDGAGKAGYTAPSIDGQIEVIATAQALAEVDPRSIAYVEAHGTGTPLGDPIEFAALSAVFRSGTDDVGFCQLGSLKANIGHLDAAAGVAGFIKTIQVLKNREFPPLVNFRSPNPQLELASSPFSIGTSARDWPECATPRRAGVSSFGIGGTNAHVVLEEAPRISERPPTVGPHLLLLSARTATALDQAKSRLASHLSAAPGIDLEDVSWTLQVGRRHFQHRAAVVAHSAEAAAQVLESSGRDISAVHDGGERPVVFMFSGQGSQHARMGAGLYADAPVYREAIDECARLLEPHLGLDIRTAIEGTHPGINETWLAQPALFLCEYALAQLWMSWGVKPAAMIGHSIGEYVAAHLAGVLTLADALALVAGRGRIMQAMAPGAMAAVHASRARAEPLIQGLAEIAAVNAPTLCAIAGQKTHIAEALRRLGQAGIETAELKTSHAFHSAMMEPALPEFRQVLEGVKLSEPAIPYISNVTGTWITGVEATSPEYWCRHLRGTVEFAKGIATIASDQTAVFLEVGPGVALSTIARMSLPKSRQVATLSSLPRPGEDEADRARMLEAAGRLWVSGVPFNWPAMHAGAESRRIPLPTYPFERQRLVIERPTRSAAPVVTEKVRSSFADNVDDFFYAPSWLRSDAVDGGGPIRLDGLWLVLDAGNPLGAALVARIGAAGGKAIRLAPGQGFEKLSDESYRVRPGVSADIDTVLSDGRHFSPVSGALYLWDLEGGEVPGGRGALALSALAEALHKAKPPGEARIIVATSGAASILDERITHASKGLAVAPTLVLPTEVPDLLVRMVDIHSRDPVSDAELLFAEAGSPDAEQFVAWRYGRRFARRYERVALAPSAASGAPFKRHGVYLITGGLGGIGLAIAKWLATHYSARLLLTGKRPLPPRSEWEDWLAGHSPRERNSNAISGVRHIEQVGGEVIVHAADAADEKSMRVALDDAVKRWGAFDGIVHCAGIKGAGRPAALCGNEDFEEVLESKHAGLETLVRLLGDARLEFVALMSSISSVVGYPANVAYASANAVLDAFVESRDRPSAWRRVLSINWDSWREVGMATVFELEHTDYSASDAYLRASISPEAGVEAFARILGSTRERVVVTPMDLSSRPSPKSRELDLQAAKETEAPVSKIVNDAADGTFNAPATPTEHALAAIWTELLGVEQIAADDSFFLLGGHSLMATRALVRIKDRFGANLVLRDIFDAPTLAKLATRIDEAVPSSATTPPAEDDDREELVF